MFHFVEMFSGLLVCCCMIILAYAKIGEKSKKVYLVVGCIFLVISTMYSIRMGREIQIMELLKDVDFSQLSGANVINAQVQISHRYGDFSVILVPNTTAPFKPPKNN